MPNRCRTKRKLSKDSNYFIAKKKDLPIESYVDKEVLSCLFKRRFMKFENCLRLESVSRGFKNAAQNYYQCMKYLDMSRLCGFRYPPGTDYNRLDIRRSNLKFTQFVHKISTYCKNLEILMGMGSFVWRTVYIEEGRYDTTCHISKEQYEMLSALKSLKSIQFDMCASETMPFQRFIMGLPNLTSLEINRESSESEEDKSKSLTRVLSYLRLKKLKFTWGVSDGTFLPHINTECLEDLNLEGCNCPSEMIQALLIKCDNLSRLNISFSIGLVADPDYHCQYSLLEAVSRLSKLTYLKMRGTSFVYNDMQMIPIFERLENLTELHIYECDFATHRFFDMLANCLTKLTVLSISARIGSDLLGFIWGKYKKLDTIRTFISNLDRQNMDAYNYQYEFKVQLKLEPKISVPSQYDNSGPRCRVVQTKFDLRWGRRDADDPDADADDLPPPLPDANDDALPMPRQMLPIDALQMRSYRDMFERVLTRAGPKTKSLRIMNMPECMNDSLFDLLAENCPNVEDLCIYEVTKPDLCLKLIRSCKKLKTLRLTNFYAGDSMLEGIECLEVLILNAKKLKYIALDQNTVQCPSLWLHPRMERLKHKIYVTNHNWDRH